MKSNGFLSIKIRQMKKYFFLIVLSGLMFNSCNELFENNHQDEKPCPVVSVNDVPQAVINAFTELYPGVNPEYWFNEDGKGYCALFKQNDQDVFVHFSNDGTFLSADEDNDNDNDSLDIDDNDTTNVDENEEYEDCECIRPK